MECSISKCHLKFANFKLYLSHIYEHKNQKNFCIKCPSCGLSFTNYFSIRSHITRKHEAEEPGTKAVTKDLRSTELVCKFENCNKDFKCNFSSFIVMDFVKHHATHCSISSPIQCPCNRLNDDCAQKFTSSGAMAKHIKRYHNDCVKGTMCLQKNIKKLLCRKFLLVTIVILI